MSPDQKKLFSVWLTEIQAIAIYEAECWVLKRTGWNSKRRTTYLTCLHILEEEKHHSSAVQIFLDPSLRKSWSVSLQRSGGFIFGFFLSLLPARMNWKIHSWAELQASDIYQQATHHFAGQFEILEALTEAAVQERAHSERFERLD